MYEITHVPGNKIFDSVESFLSAYRMSHAVSRWNGANPDKIATFEIYSTKEAAQPPIDTPDAAPGEIYARMSYPVGALSVIQSIQAELSQIDSPAATIQ